MTAIQMVACVVEINDMQINVSALTLQPLAPPPRPLDASWSVFSQSDNLTVDDPRVSEVALYHVSTLLVAQ